MSVRAAVMTAPGAPIELWDLPDPTLEPGAVLLETVASEVCGTDVHLHRGQLAGVPYPIVPGHVSVGRVAETRGVDRDATGEPLAVGDLVTFYDVHEVCNECWYCTIAKQPNRCPSRRVYGITYSAHEGVLGGWAERIYLKPGVRVLRIPGTLSADDVIGGGCGLFTGFAAVDRTGLRLGDTVVIQGAGPVGLSAAAFALLNGASWVAIVGAPEARLTLARALGVDAALSIETQTPDERRDFVKARTGGRGADVVIEASGNPEAVTEGLELIRDGGTYVIAGHYTDAGTVPVNPHVHVNQPHVEIRGQWGTEFRHVTRALTMLARHSDRLPLARVIGARYALADAGRALEDVAALRVTKAVVVPRT
jgi:L-iditol 2-dehydrogenase